jgi:outer membrane protein OmpA-like peptidoglycan-associated protein
MMLAGVAASTTAQEKEKYVSEKASDNIFMSVGVGVSSSMYREGNRFDFGNSLSPHITLSLGKWINPTWGFRGQVGFWQDKVNSGWGETGSYREVSDGYYVPYAGITEKYNVTTGRLRLDGLFNLSNAIWGYNPDRLFNLSIFAGPGLIFANSYDMGQIVGNQNTGTWSRDAGDKKLRTFVNGSVGLLGKFNLSSCIDLDIEARGELSPAYDGDLTYAQTTGGLFVTAGLTYTFGGKTFIPYGSKVDQQAINDEINRYRDQLAQAQNDLAQAKSALSKAQSQRPVTKEVVKEVQTVGPRAIFFRIGSSVLDDYGKVNIELAAKVMKANPDKKYKIAGYADKATGSTTTNQKLSDKRAQVVYDALVAQGVDKSQLSFAGQGATPNMFGKDYLNRVVILE